VPTIRPLHNNVIVKRLKARAETAGGLLIPETAKERPQEGLVISVGNGKLLTNGDIKAVDVQEGDTVLFGKYSGIEARLGDENILILGEDDILAVLQDKKAYS